MVNIGRIDLWNLNTSIVVVVVTKILISLQHTLGEQRTGTGITALLVGRTALTWMMRMMSKMYIEIEYPHTYENIERQYKEMITSQTDRIFRWYQRGYKGDDVYAHFIDSLRSDDYLKQLHEEFSHFVSTRTYNGIHVILGEEV